MSITDELRKWGYGFCGSSYEVVNAIADRIDAEHERIVRETGEEIVRDVRREWVRLPVDADGVPWRIGDITESGQTVEAMGLNRHGWHFVGTVNEIDPAIHHHHAPTVEDMLLEMLYKAHIYDKREMELLPDLIAEYAAKLRLKEG